MITFDGTSDENAIDYLLVLGLWSIYFGEGER